MGFKQFVKLGLLGATLLVIAAWSQPGWSFTNNEQTLKAQAAEIMTTMSQQKNNPYLAEMALETLNRFGQELGLASRLETNFAESEIALESTMHGGLLVPVDFQHKHAVKFLLDTGASYTMISPELADELGLDVRNAKRSIAIVTANGKVHVPLIDVPILKLGNVTLHNVEVLIQPLDTRLGFDGLLGMNALNQAEWRLEKERLVLKASR